MIIDQLCALLSGSVENLEESLKSRVNFVLLSDSICYNVQYQPSIATDETFNR